MEFASVNAKLADGVLPCHVGGSGDPLLCLHSAGGVRISPALERLAQQRRLYVPVFPGFDGTERWPQLRTMADLADLAAELIDRVIGRPCDVIGHSFGGWVASWLAVRHPDKVEQLVLHAPAGFRPDGVGGLVGGPAELRRLMFAHPENLPAEQKPAEMQARNRAMLQHYQAEAATDRDLVVRLGDIKALTLILHGTKDGVIPIASPRLLKARIGRSHLIYVYDAAHGIDVDQPERFARLVGDFLARGEAFIVNHADAAPETR
jgi:pimeloyl-ACP methyl ester carboxylesterase